MNEVIDFFTSNTTVAYLTAFAIFIITIILLINRLIGFMITLLLLAFAILSGLAIANHDLFREILTNFRYDPEKNKEDKLTHFKNQLSHTYDELKEEFQQQKKKLESMYDTYQKSESSPQAPSKEEEETKKNKI
jgi:hypothetical protein